MQFNYIAKVIVAYLYYDNAEGFEPGIHIVFLRIINTRRFYINHRVFDARFENCVTLVNHSAETELH
jgi:hypothetical protein